MQHSAYFALGFINLPKTANRESWTKLDWIVHKVKM